MPVLAASSAAGSVLGFARWRGESVETEAAPHPSRRVADCLVVYVLIECDLPDAEGSSGCAHRREPEKGPAQVQMLFRCGVGKAVLGRSEVSLDSRELRVEQILLLRR